VLGWKKLGHEERWKAYIVNYADDLVYLLSSWSRASSNGDAEDDVKAEVDGGREQEAGLSSAGRKVRLSGLYVRATLLVEEKPILSSLPRSGHSASVELSATKPGMIQGNPLISQALA
jgi:hypothetical protein